MNENDLGNAVKTVNEICSRFTKELWENEDAIKKVMEAATISMLGIGEIFDIDSDEYDNAEDFIWDIGNKAIRLFQIITDDTFVADDVLCYDGMSWDDVEVDMETGISITKEILDVIANKI